MTTSRSLPTPAVLTVYGAEWCGDCWRAKRHLEAAGIPFRYVDLERDPAAQRLLDGAGYRAIPVIVTPTGRVLVEPSNAELDALRG
jgi:glutaredoxin